ncbi:hypothetical protein FC52_GL000935 [Lactobacillus pasteurii DSM 23907 = CRBIP 24.76]|uniref:Uncharacterized protein n=1 Tax=Lactobacillus pasteurii DSM 23907 = CRBIP 24.76 TaxID=1423790 RepID=I7LDF8_9LACO|nr:hypothetical protein [Lactobacillus pasteurii]KRK08199.1 hypothetical protein FC52_GL000935 [Lactobacillus pasteurii DSM 23907 = CRBIP 24.76]TDG77318.1 hypothetical protein C5L33_000761 [Lactobacillus pasteurii]CCI84863.1 Protein of unknown function [Lactobacillus pasteurii DSM 23907 = CRBIP 24.76]
MKKALVGAGAVIAGIGAGYAAIKLLHKKSEVVEDIEDEDRGVSPIEEVEEEKDEKIKPTADAINRPYKPIEY